MKNNPSITIFLSLILFLLIFYSCKNDNEESDNMDSLKITIIDSTTIDSSNITVSSERIVADTQILFFMPSPKERQDFIKFYGVYSQYEFQTMFTNFGNLSNSVKSAMRTSGIPVEVTYAKKFIFPLSDDTLIYDLSIEGQMLGFILSDGINYPLIRNGVQKTRDVSNDIRNYFNISNFSIYWE
ncbi:MAG: hypothetical protein JXR68_03930 [Bacteroidales bacterium]|nr:hypothetical protein [Bacteroidales bacterium]